MDETYLNRILADHEDDGDGRGRGLRRERGGERVGDDHRDPSGDELSRQCWQATDLAARPPGFDRCISAFDEAGFLQALAHRR